MSRSPGTAPAALALIALLSLIATPLVAQDADPAPAVVEAEATPTRLVVRVVANDAKIIGSGVGGAYVVVRDTRTGEILAQGLQEGGTGNTDAIMGDRSRGVTVFDTDGAAAFRAEIPLTGPTPVRVEYRAPLSVAHATQEGAISLLLLPGEHLDGEGVVVNLNGFTVELVEPAEEPFEVRGGDAYEVQAKVTMLCGCPTEPGGLWDADRMEITAHWVRNGRVVASAAMAYTGVTSHYTATLPALETPGPVTLRVTAVDRGRANTGMAEALGRVR